MVADMDIGMGVGVWEEDGERLDGEEDRDGNVVVTSLTSSDVP